MKTFDTNIAQQNTNIAQQNTIYFMSLNLLKRFFSKLKILNT